MGAHPSHRFTHIIRWHALAAGAHEEDTYLSLGVENTLIAVERIVAERTRALAEEIEGYRQGTVGALRRAEAAEADRDRLRAGIEALADTWDANRARNGRPMLTTANVVDRLRALLDGGAS